MTLLRIKELEAQLQRRDARVTELEAEHLQELRAYRTTVDNLEAQLEARGASQAQPVGAVPVAMAANKCWGCAGAGVVERGEQCCVCEGDGFCKPRRYEPEIFREDRIRMEPDSEGDWVKHEDYSRLLGAYRHAQPAAQALDAWLPIATAPKNGCTLLLGYFNAHGKWRTLRGQWFADDVIAETWEDPDQPEGWYETPVEIDDAPNCFWTLPTHWMPLPSPPAIAAQQGEKK